MANPSFKDLLSQKQKDSLKTIVKPAAPVSPALEKARAAIKHSEENPDSSLFMQAMMGVKPLKSTAQVATTPVQDKHAKQLAMQRRIHAEGTPDIDGANLSDMQALLNPVTGDAYLSYKNPTLQNKVFEDLRQGKLRWYDAVDLHGSTIEDARNAVQLLIHHATEAGETVVKIVHGKGKDATIKTCVNGWLRQMDNVMAFVSASSKDGGHGAVLVLLKRKSSTNADA